VAVLVFAGSLLLAQAPQAVPVDQEPQHKVVLKNDFVRIIDATLPPGYVTLNHTHAVDNVSVTVANGREGEAGQRGLGRAGFSKGGYSHSVTNSGAAIMRYIVIEPFKSDRPGAEASPKKNPLIEEYQRVNQSYERLKVSVPPGSKLPDLEMLRLQLESLKKRIPPAEFEAAMKEGELSHHTLDSENERVRIYRVKLAAGESLDSHTHATGRVQVSVYGPGGAGKWAWVGAGENRPVKVPTEGPAVEFVEVEPK
jgi:quercetin dioxygenase-like cupin family protein